MNTEPPIGDDLQRLLVEMKHTVLEKADEVSSRPVRRRHIWPVVGLVALIAVGTASGAYAAGLVPQNLFGTPAAAPSPTVSHLPSPSPSAPETRPPSSPPTPTTTSKVFSIDDPGTWTTSFTEVGPVAIGASYTGEIDDLSPAYSRGNANCPNPNVSFWNRTGSVSLVVVQKDGVVSGVSIGLVSPSDPSYRSTAPTTAEGAGIGTTLGELKAMYPDLVKTGSYGNGDASGSFDYWSIHSSDGFITFELDTDGTHVGQVWVGSVAQPPYEFCG